LSTQLFELPEYHRAFSRFLNKAIHELMRRKNPVLGMIKSIPSARVSTVRNTMPSGEVVENKPMMVKMPFMVQFQDAIKGDSGSLLESIDIAAEEGLKVIMPQFYEYLGRLCQAAGTSTDAKGEKVSPELIRKSLENVEIDFDEHDMPIMPTMVLHPDMLKQLSELPPPTEEEIKAFNDLIERKKREFNDRRRHRKLS